MFDFTEEEETTFYKNNIERIAKKLTTLPYCKEVIKRLREQGIEIYIITARDNGDYTKPLEMTKEWLKKFDIEYDKLILTKPYCKGIACEENNIDIMIDDSVNTLKDVKKHNVKCLFMNTRYNQWDKEFERVNYWDKIYDRIMQEKVDNEKINVILDTDICNECDDQFALAYLLKSQERFNIDAITIAPFKHENGYSIEDGLNKSYDEIINISNYLNFDYTNKIFKGSKEYLNNDNVVLNQASQKIIEIAKQNDKTYIVAIGAITNIAIAILQEPSIIDKIEIVWLGGNYLLCKDNYEFNFKQDVQAVKSVFNSGVKLTVIPAKGVASNLMISIYELEHHLRNKNELCNHLCDVFINDGIHGIRKRRVIWDISAGFGVVQKSDRLWYYIKSDGTFLNDEGFRDAQSFIGEFAAVKKSDGFWYYMKLDGTFLNNEGLKDGYDFSEGVCRVKKRDNLWYYMKSDSTFLNNEGFREAENFCNGIAGVLTLDLHWHNFDINGTLI